MNLGKPSIVSLPASSGKGINISVVLITVVVLVIIIILFAKGVKFFEGFLEGIGVRDSKDEAANKEDIDRKVNRESTAGNNSAWSPSFYKAAPSGTKLVTLAVAQSIAKKIWDSVGYITDTPAQGAGAIKQLQTKAAVSFIADTFFKKYGIDLLAWLQSKYDTSEQKEYLADILRYVENLPKYK